MKRMALIIVPLFLATQSAWATDVTGSDALALAALSSLYSTTVSAADRQAATAMFDGNVKTTAAAGPKISISADSIICRQSDVDITSRSCALTFGKKTVDVTGRSAHELFATIAEVGVQPDGAAGTIYEGLSQLACTIDPQVVLQRSGGGADCTFEDYAP